MNILDRTLVIKSPIPPEDIKVLWIDMSSKPKSIKVWDSNTGNWENLDSSNNGLDIAVQVGDNAYVLKKGDKTVYPFTHASVVGLANGTSVEDSLSNMVTKFADGLLRTSAGQFFPITRSELVQYGESTLFNAVTTLNTKISELESKILELENK